MIPARFSSSLHSSPPYRASSRCSLLLSASHPPNVMHNPWSVLLQPVTESVVTFLLHEQTNVCLSISECYTTACPFPTSFFLSFLNMLPLQFLTYHGQIFLRATRLPWMERNNLNCLSRLRI